MKKERKEKSSCRKYGLKNLKNMQYMHIAA
jgi:hypothetical protein